MLGVTQKQLHGSAPNFDYDARGRLAESFVGAVGTSYQINGLGQRVGKTQGQVLFAYDGRAT